MTVYRYNDALCYDLEVDLVHLINCRDGVCGECDRIRADAAEYQRRHAEDSPHERMCHCRRCREAHA